jgi:hypothetical protein
MLENFLNLWPTVKIIIQLSKSKIFKNKYLILFENKIKCLEKGLKILKIFVKVTTKLQAKVYPTIYYMISEIYAINSRLDRVKTELNISFQILILGQPMSMRL